MNILSGIRHTLIQHFSPVSLHANVAEDCSFCLEGMSDSRSISVSICSHRFHSSCIKKWLKERSDCPMCRRDVCIIADTGAPLHYAAAQGQQEAIDALIARGADVNARTKDGKTPLHCAAAQGHQQAIGALIARGADVNARTKDGRTPLHCAAAQGHQEAIDALIARVADVNARTKEGDTALKKASDNKKINITMIKSFANAGFDVNAPCNHLGSTMLVYAAEVCDWGFVDKLKAKGADINGPKDIETKYTPLHFAAAQGQQEAIDALIARGADVNARTRYGFTPLHCAAAKGQQEAIGDLIARGADINARTKGGRTPLQYATEKGQQEAVDALIAYGATLQ
ncbi:ankyrin repeat domain-containing protein [Endozoicomonas sp. YOMI1]|uniref:ankyrin repeat domain-containing protein n=1 Tax=Endozoicomonas sp. YOMI1 TaxID=2828739 RepID=UPI0021487398|nr:ankyrin repeat domain-containing protein [Endozoicomonas sp. YOMI1]